MNIRTTLVLLAALALSACGGGGGGDRDTTLAPVGVYSGTIIEEGISYEVGGIIPEGEMAYLFSPQSGGITFARIETDGASLSGAFDTYLAISASELTVTGERAVSGSLSGTVTANSFTASFNTSQGTSGTVNVNKSPANQIPGGLASLAGNWAATDSTGTTTVVIESDGELIGSDSDGCQFTGQITPGAMNANASEIDVTIACPGEPTGSASGAIARALPLGEQKRLLVIFGNNDRAVAGLLFEQ